MASTHKVFHLKGRQEIVLIFKEAMANLSTGMMLNLPKLNLQMASFLDKFSSRIIALRLS